MNTFFGIIQEKAAILNEDESLHCVKVLRHKVGDEIKVIDGNGTVAFGNIAAAHAKQCAIAITQKQIVPKHRNYQITVAVAPTKNIERIEWFVEKAVEVGIDEIIFIKTKNSERTVVKTERIRKVAESALKQSQQAYLPTITELIDYKEFVKTPSSSIKLIAHCEKNQKQHINQFFKPNQAHLILIGPEGDFTNDEIKLAIDNGFIPISLGETRLRTETAALYSCMAFNALSHNNLK